MDGTGRFKSSVCLKHIIVFLLWEQNLIGSEHLFHDQFSIEWSHLQDDYYARQLNNTQIKTRTGYRWHAASYHLDQHLHTRFSLFERSATKISTVWMHLPMQKLVHNKKCLLSKDITQTHFLKTTVWNKNWLAGVYGHGPLVWASIKRA